MGISGERRTKLWLIGGGAGVVVAALGILVALSLTVWAAPQKQDYVAAQTAVRSAEASYKKIADPYTTYFTAIGKAYDKASSPAAAEKAVVDDKKAFDTALAAHLDDVEAIDTMRALNDKEVRARYDKYESHEAAYASYMKNYLAAHLLYMRASSYSCADVFTASKAAKNAKSISEYLKLYGESNRTLSKDCLEDLAALMKSPNRPYATYAAAYRQYFIDRQALIDKAQQSPDAARTLSDDLSKLTAPVQNATHTFIMERQKDLAEVAKSNTADALYQLLEKKVKTAKS